MSDEKTLTIATRGSQLALWQARFVASRLEAEGFSCQLNTVKTTGDKVQNRFLHEIGGKGVFIKELEHALERREADLAVHSLKDMPARVTEPFALAAVLPRHSPFDALIVRSDLAGPKDLPETTVAPDDIGRLGVRHFATGSLRRQSILKKYLENVHCEGLRGNVDTRILKLEDGAADAVILAEASLDRLQLEGVTYRRLDPSWFLPCASQGALAVETLADHPLRKRLEEILGCADTRLCTAIEREVLARLGGSCTMPISCHVEPTGSAKEMLLARASLYDPTGRSADARVEAARDAQFSETGFVNDVMNQLAADGAAKILRTLDLPVPAEVDQRTPS